jgi:predicted XRE-type DNA-binding protein
MKKPAKKRYFTITEAADELGLTRQGVHDLIRRGILRASRGKIVHIKIVQGWKIPAKALEAYRNRRTK